MTSTDNIVNLVEKATNVSTFSVLDAIQGRTFPTDTITLYTDAASAYQAEHLLRQAANEPNGEKATAIHAQRDELIEKIKASGLTFHLQGFSPAITQAIEDRVDAAVQKEEISENDRNFKVNMNNIAEMILKVVNAQGAEDSHKWTADEVEALKGTISPEEFTRLWDKVVEVGFAALLYDQTVSADFS